MANNTTNVLHISAFYEYFKGNKEAYGTTDIVKGEYDEQGKLRTKSRLIHEEPTPAVIGRHLSGEKSIGIAPINNNGKCRWGAIDIDNYDRSLLRIVNAIYELNMPICPFWSKSKKLHLFLFLNEEVFPVDLRNLLKRYFSLFSLDQKTEIFPKQKLLTDVNAMPSWINLPYFGDTRQMVGPNDSLCDLEGALSFIKNKQFSLKDHNTYLDSMPYSDAPPCIQSGCILRDIPRGRRNNFLFSVGVYFRLKDEGADLAPLLKSVNDSLLDPIDDKRLEETVLSGLKRKSYFYLCKDLIGCNKEACREQDFGIESKESTGLDYGDLSQYKTDPPYYAWIVNGHQMIFYSEAEMLNQNKFRELCLRYLHTVPRKVQDPRWVKILNRAMENIVVHEVTDDVGGFSHGSQFLQHTIDFFVSRRPADDESQLALGRTWYDEKNDQYVFKATAYLAYIKNVKDFRVYSTIELQTKLQQMGAIQEGPYWIMKKKDIPIIPEKEIKIDFRDKNNEEDDY